MAKELTFRSPGFFETEIDASSQRQAPLGIPAGVIGTANQGPAFVPISVGSFQDFTARFGGLDPKSFGPYAVNEFLKHRSAVTYLRVLGAGANDSTADIEKTRITDQVRNAGFVVTGTAPTDASWSGHNGAVQFICAQHSVSTNEAFGMPMFTDNDSVSATLPNLVRGMVLLASGARLLVSDGDSSLPAVFAAPASKDQSATVDSSGHFKLILSSTLAAAFSTTDGLPGLRVYTASLDPTSPNYVGKLLNTDPESFPSAQHLLYGDFAVDAQIASASSNAGAVAVLSGSASTSGASGDRTMAFRDVFGHLDTRYRAPKTPWIITQPYGTAEYDLFYFEAVDDGAVSNSRYKVSISNIRKSGDPSDEHGTFSVLIRSFDDTDTNQAVLELFPDCNLDPLSDRFVGQIIGDRTVRYNFDAETDSERRLVVKGTYPRKSQYVRIVLSDALQKGELPATALPFGFRGYEVPKTNDALRDSLPGNPIRLAGEVAGVLGTTSSLVPPVPLRFKVTRGEVASSGFAGNPGASELTNANLYWGVKFERTTDALNANASSEPNRLVETYTKLLGLRGLDAFVTGSGADSFCDNKFTLARVALSNTSVADLTASAATHMREAAYIRNADPDGSTYTVNDGVLTGRITLGTLVALTSSVDFNRFTSFNKFSLFMQGGFDGVNILDRDAKRLNDRSTSFDTGGGAESTFLSPGLSTNQNGAETLNNAVQSYRSAVKVMTDEMSTNINLLAIPGLRESYITDFAGTKTRDYGLAMYVMDVVSYDDNGLRLYDDSTQYPDVDKSADRLDSRAIDNNCVATYFPDVQIDDVVNNRRVTVPASVAAMAALGFNDRVAAPWFAPAGFNRAALDFVKNARVRVSAADRDRLQDSRVNPIAPFPRQGFVIMGQKTMQFKKSALDRVNVRRMMLEVKRVISDIAGKLVFEQSVPATWLTFVNEATTQLALIQAGAGIERFVVVMNESNNSDIDVQNNRMNGRVSVVPTRAVEFIDLAFIITNTDGVEFL